MSHTIKGKKKLLARVRRIKGQTESIEKALESGMPCLNILQQIAAVRGAVNGLMTEVLEGHIREHLMDESHSSQERSSDLEEIVSVIRSYLK
ncbi:MULTISPECIES: metal/formaldehyde-sensitive transcriptional repressor [unclassified Brenneria]|uniref:metal/formaldehyde-sensitive transcriptional repressor n=1 Tax=unclassified Brenneria TaxID=2634434 RepID=UPI001551EDE4|nr:MULTISPECIES: metal/formaldehyde-sensitive transcriptional repressor [unclassified Brenneria]MBJ7222612.1 metal/formaldehyde-sensitive transcriptional repressor [Brenneria sp. L3-3C-1]MEE3643855.1 metal/formaldehyde-sensitive transcriptional repressor [Brenneria sp. L3_3C_1]MEE3651192.1 metal/formaldehyde-sensitive transcriptional repressor [Brenneria sp. HEZEL_4_2_4]NPD01147.1 metal/formaldehyde-sensitive transcriptional repressor [Brenneria sp. hezel4-2-4]